jgi:hypothetical protein
MPSAWRSASSTAWRLRASFKKSQIARQQAQANSRSFLGGGVPLLAPGSGRTRLRLVSSRSYQATGTVALEYAVG